MALKVYAKQEDIPEALRAEYTKGEDGKWYPDIEDIRSHPGAKGLKSALDAEKEEVRKFKLKYKDLPEDFDLEDYRKIKEKQAADERDRQLKAGEFDKREAELVKKHNDDMAKAKTREGILVKQIRKLALENEARKALEGKAMSVELQLPHVMAELDLVEDEAGEFSPIVIDPSAKVKEGERRSPRVASAQGGNMTIAQLVDEQLEREHFLANKKGAGGSGSGIIHHGGKAGAKVVAADDKSFSDNLEEIAAGKVTVAST